MRVAGRRHSSSRFYDARPYHMHTELSVDVDSPSNGQVICNSCNRRLAKGLEPVTADAASAEASNLGNGFGSVPTVARQLESALGSSNLSVIVRSDDLSHTQTLPVLRSTSVTVNFFQTCSYGHPP